MKNTPQSLVWLRVVYFPVYNTRCFLSFSGQKRVLGRELDMTWKKFNFCYTTDLPILHVNLFHVIFCSWLYVSNSLILINPDDDIFLRWRNADDTWLPKISRPSEFHQSTFERHTFVFPSCVSPGSDSDHVFSEKYRPKIQEPIILNGNQWHVSA